MRNWLARLVKPAVVYFIYLGVLLPFAPNDKINLITVVGVPFGFAAAYIWDRAAAKKDQAKG